MCDIKSAYRQAEVYPFQRGDRLYTSESDVYRRHIVTYKDGPRTERSKIFLVVVDP